MEIKLLEVRDDGTFIPVLCIWADHPENHAQRYLLRRCGYPLDGWSNIIMTPLRADGSPATNDPYFWNDRTYKVSHNWITENWAILKDGDVVDVSYILEETKTKKTSERLE